MSTELSQRVPCQSFCRMESRKHCNPVSSFHCLVIGFGDSLHQSGEEFNSKSHQTGGGLRDELRRVRFCRSLVVSRAAFSPSGPFKTLGQKAKPRVINQSDPSAIPLPLFISLNKKKKRDIPFPRRVGRCEKKICRSVGLAASKNSCKITKLQNFSSFGVGGSGRRRVHLALRQLSYPLNSFRQI